MQQLTDKIFERLGTSCTRLTALIFDVRALHDDCGRPVLWYGYLRGTQFDNYGRKATVSIPIERHMIKHHEPCSEILDF